MKHTLVTGGNGFIGSYVVEELKKRGHKVSVFDRRRIEPFEGFFGDIKDATLVTDAVSHVDGVIHLAGILGTQETINNPRPAAETNILGGLNVIEACAQYDVPLVSISVGNHWMQNTYSITKDTVARFVKMTQKYRGKQMGTVRALNAYGPGQKASAPYGPSRVRKVMPSFICRALSGEPIEIYGTGNQVMDMIHAHDVAWVLVSALDYLESSGSLPDDIEAGTGVDTTVNDIAEEVAKAVMNQSDVNVTVAHLPMRPGEDKDSVVLADTSTLAFLGITPDKLIQMKEGVPETVAYYKQYLDEG
jgi:nucleoside-diphosphate-sugar epimerase